VLHPWFGKHTTGIDTTIQSAHGTSLWTAAFFKPAQQSRNAVDALVYSPRTLDILGLRQNFRHRMVSVADLSLDWWPPELYARCIV